MEWSLEHEDAQNRIAKYEATLPHLSRIESALPSDDDVTLSMLRSEINRYVPPEVDAADVSDVQQRIDAIRQNITTAIARDEAIVGT